jgi:hypothetical protein
MEKDARIVPRASPGSHTGLQSDLHLKDLVVVAGFASLELHSHLVCLRYDP